MFRRSDKKLSIDTTVADFEQNIRQYEDIIYGTAIFFECLSLLHADETGFLETHRKQFRNIIQQSNEILARARKALEQVSEQPKLVDRLESFEFTPCPGHPKPDQLAERARNLVKIYESIFPGRPREKDLTADEILKLIDAFADGFPASQHEGREETA